MFVIGTENGDLNIFRWNAQALANQFSWTNQTLTGSIFGNETAGGMPNTMGGGWAVSAPTVNPFTGQAMGGGNGWNIGGGGMMDDNINMG